jgi:NDP-sugar pyrophosphorylase family protein
MKAMILAAGLGTRLRPLTDDRPKALVEIHGHTLLEIALRRLQSFGISDVIVNVYHFADKVIDCLETNGNFGMNISISREVTLLDTGGGLKRAAYFFCGKGAEDEPFILHNVDVISTIDLERMAQFHRQNGALATLAVQTRSTSRYLLFDEHGALCGRRAGVDGVPELFRPVTKTDALAFSGVHVISPRIFSMLGEDEVFPIVPAYLRFAGVGEKVLAFRADEYYWRDLGRPESITQAGRDLDEGKYSIC